MKSNPRGDWDKSGEKGSSSQGKGDGGQP